MSITPNRSAIPCLLVNRRRPADNVLKTLSYEITINRSRFALENS